MAFGARRIEPLSDDTDILRQPLFESARNPISERKTVHDWDQAEEFVARAEQLMLLGRGVEAEQALRQAIEIDPSRGEWHVALAGILESLDRLEEALASMRQAAILLPDEPGPLSAIAEFCLRLQRLPEALEFAERAAEVGEIDERCHAVRIAVLHQLDRHDEAELVYFEAQQNYEEMPFCLVAMGDLKADQEEFDRASWCYREAMRQSPRMPGIRSRIAALLAESGRPERALQLHLAELRENPASIDSLLAAGRLLVVLNRRIEAIDRFKRVLEIEPANIRAHWELGLTALSMGRFDDARMEFEVVRRLDPETPLVRRRLAEALLGVGRVEDARRQLHEALLRIADEEPPEELGLMAGLLMQVDLLDEARPILERLVDRDPEDLETQRRLAACRYRLGDRVGGVAISRRILRRDPGCIRSLHNLALAALEDRRFVTCFNWLRRGLSVAPTDRGLRRLRSRLYTLWAWTWTIDLPRTMARRIARRSKADPES